MSLLCQDKLKALMLSAHATEGEADLHDAGLKSVCLIYYSNIILGLRSSLTRAVNKNFEHMLRAFSTEKCFYQTHRRVKDHVMLSAMTHFNLFT